MKNPESKVEKTTNKQTNKKANKKVDKKTKDKTKKILKKHTQNTTTPKKARKKQKPFKLLKLCYLLGAIFCKRNCFLYPFNFPDFTCEITYIFEFLFSGFINV